MKRQILSIFLVLCASMSHAYIICGHIQCGGREIADAEVRCLTVDTDSIVSATVSLSDGTYTLEGVPGGAYRLGFSKEGFEDQSRQIDVKEDMSGVNIEVNEVGISVELDELIVNGDVIQSYAGKDVMYLTAQNRKHGVNALDAISSLPLFIPTIDGSQLKNLSHESVEILIEGRKASLEELRNLNGNDIEKVEYYTHAPAKYAALYGDNIANVFLRRPKELKVDIGLHGNTATAYTSFGGTADIVLMDPHNYATAYYSLTHQNKGHIRASETFDYGDSRNDFQTEDGISRNDTHYVNLNYQWSGASDMFYIQGSYNEMHSRSTLPLTLTETNSVSAAGGFRKNWNDRKSRNASYNLYYSHTFGNGSELCADFVNTYMEGDGTSRTSQQTDEESSYQNYSVENTTSNRIFSVIGQITYSMPLWEGNFSVSVYERYVRLRQNFIDTYLGESSTAIRQSENNLTGSASYYRAFGNLSCNLSLLCTYDRFTSEGGPISGEVRLYPRITLNRNFGRSVSVMLSANMQSSRQNLTQRNDNLTFIDTRYFSQNFIETGTMMTYCGNLSSNINLWGGRIFMRPFVSYSYHRNPEFDNLYKEDGVYILRRVRLKDANIIDYGLPVTLRVVDNLTFTPSFSGNWSRYRMPYGLVSRNVVYFSLNATYIINKFQFAASCTTPYTNVSGRNEEHVGWNVSAQAYYTYRNLYVGLGYNYSNQNNWMRTSGMGFTYSANSGSIPRQRYNVNISAGYTFSAGRLNSMSMKGKSIVNREKENGL